MSRQTRKTTKIADAKALMSDLGGKEPLPPAVKKEDAPHVEPEAQPPTVGPPPDESGKESSPPAQATEAQGQDDDSGKDSLPPAQPEAQEAQAAQPAEPDADEDGDDEDGDEDEDGDLDAEDRGDPVFTEKDGQDLVVLERKVKTAGLENARALKEIRTRQLWKYHKNEDGSRRYRRFEDYCQERLGKTKQWVTQQTKWLATVELLASCRAKGLDVPEFLNPTASNSLYGLDQCGRFQGTEDEQEEQGLVAVIKETVSDGLTLTGKHLGAVCQRLSAFYGESGEKKPAAPTYEDYKDDLKVVGEVKELPYEWNVPGKVVKEQQESGVSYAEAVGRVYLKEGKRPYDTDLLHHATGTDLRAVVDQLLVARKKRQAVEEAKAQAKAKREQARLAREAQEQAEKDAGIFKDKPKRKGNGKDAGGDDGDQDQDVQVELHYELKVTQPTLNPNTFAYEDRDDLKEKLTDLLEEAEKQPVKPGDESALTLTLTVKAISPGEDEKVVQDAERMVREEQG